MAHSTQQYKSEAIALHSQGLSLRAIEKALALQHGRKVVGYATIYRWIQKSSEASDCAVYSTVNGN